MKMKNFFLIFFSFAFIYILISPLRGVYIDTGDLSPLGLSALAGFILYFFSTIYVFRKFTSSSNRNWILFTCVLGASIIPLPFHIIHFEATLSSSFVYWVSLIGVIGGYFFYRIRKMECRIPFLIIWNILGIGLSVYGSGIWAYTITFGNLPAGKIKEATWEHSDVIFQSSDGENIRLSDFSGNYFLIDCWHTYCGVCYEEMPEIQALYEEYKNKDDIVIYSLHCRIENRETEKETYIKGEEILKERGYNIPCLSIPIENEGLKKLGVKVYPTILIFDKKGCLVYRGNLKFAKKYLEKLFA